MVTNRGVLQCPCPQPKASAGDRPDPELLKRVIRCHKGEKPVADNEEGAVTVEVASLQVGEPRKFIYGQDLHGKPGTLIHPVKVQYTVKTHYRTRIAAEENWIRVLNFYVNEFGEWSVASEVPVRSPDVKSIPR
jgi:hypothetical protein